MKKLALIMISFLFLLSMPAWAGGIRVSRADLIAQEQKLDAEEKELRAKAYELRANGDEKKALELEQEAESKSEEAARLRAQIDALALAEEEAGSSAQTSAGISFCHVTKKKTTRSVTKGGSFQILADGQQVRSFNSGNKKVASVSKTGVVKAKNPGTARITITLKNRKKWTVTVKVGPDRDLSKLMGIKYTGALTAVGGKASQVFRDGKNGDDYSVYKKKGLTLLGLDHKRYRKNRLYKRVWQIELNKKSSFTMFGVKVGDTVKPAMVRLFLGGCTDLSADSWNLSAKAPGGDLFIANVRNGVITGMKLERRY